MGIYAQSSVKTQTKQNQANREELMANQKNISQIQTQTKQNQANREKSFSKRQKRKKQDNKTINYRLTVKLKQKNFEPYRKVLVLL